MVRLTKAQKDRAASLRASRIAYAQELEDRRNKGIADGSIVMREPLSQEVIDDFRSAPRPESF